MPRPSIPLIVRFADKVDRRGAEECWPWTGATRRDGYGVIALGGGDRRLGAAHRVALYLAHGYWPDGDVDHECHNADASCAGGHDCPHRLCCNPRHLAAKPHALNLTASPLTIVGMQARQTHCASGHAFTPENTYLYRGMRYCRACRRAWQSAHTRRPQATLSLP